MYIFFQIHSAMENFSVFPSPSQRLQSQLAHLWQDSKAHIEIVLVTLKQAQIVFIEEITSWEDVQYSMNNYNFNTVMFPVTVVRIFFYHPIYIYFIFLNNLFKHSHGLV